MPPRRQHPVHIRVWETIKRNPIKSAAAVLGLFGAYPAGFAGANLIAKQSEPSWYASHSWVREHVDERIKPVTTAQADDRAILRDLQIDGAARSLRDEKNSQAQWLIKRKEVSDPLTLDLIDRQINSSKESIDALDAQLRTLKELKSKGQ